MKAFITVSFQTIQFILIDISSKSKEFNLPTVDLNSDFSSTVPSEIKKINFVSCITEIYNILRENKTSDTTIEVEYDESTGSIHGENILTTLHLLGIMHTLNQAKNGNSFEEACNNSCEGFLSDLVGKGFSLRLEYDKLQELGEIQELQIKDKVLKSIEKKLSEVKLDLYGPNAKLLNLNTSSLADKESSEVKLEDISLELVGLKEHSDTSDSDKSRKWINVTGLIERAIQIKDVLEPDFQTNLDDKPSNSQGLMENTEIIPEIDSKEQLQSMITLAEEEKNENGYALNTMILIRVIKKIEILQHRKLEFEKIIGEPSKDGILDFEKIYSTLTDYKIQLFDWKRQSSEIKGKGRFYFGTIAEVLSVIAFERIVDNMLAAYLVEVVDNDMKANIRKTVRRAKSKVGVDKFRIEGLYRSDIMWWESKKPESEMENNSDRKIINLEESKYKALEEKIDNTEHNIIQKLLFRPVEDVQEGLFRGDPIWVKYNHEEKDGAIIRCKLARNDEEEIYIMLHGRVFETRIGEEIFNHLDQCFRSKEPIGTNITYSNLFFIMICRQIYPGALPSYEAEEQLSITRIESSGMLREEKDISKAKLSRRKKLVAIFDTVIFLLAVGIGALGIDKLMQWGSSIGKGQLIYLGPISAILISFVFAIVAFTCFNYKILNQAERRIDLPQVKTQSTKEVDLLMQLNKTFQEYQQDKQPGQTEALVNNFSNDFIPDDKELNIIKPQVDYVLPKIEQVIFSSDDYNSFSVENFSSASHNPKLESEIY